VRHAYCFCVRVPRKQTRLLSELHFALVSPAVMRAQLADFGAISRIDRTYPNVKAATACMCPAVASERVCDRPPQGPEKCTYGTYAPYTRGQQSCRREWRAGPRARRDCTARSGRLGLEHLLGGHRRSDGGQAIGDGHGGGAPAHVYGGERTVGSYRPAPIATNNLAKTS
jgi:hypothetical protein